MNKLYSTIPVPNLKRNGFSLSHRNYLTMNQHQNVVSLIKETLPGDLWMCNLETFCRVQPMIAPPLSNISISHHAFYVPMRTLNDNWEDFITGGREGTNTKVLPYTSLGDIYNFIVEAYGTGNYTKECVSAIKCFDYMGVNFEYPQNLASNADFVESWISLNGSLSSDYETPVNLLPFLAVAKIWDEYYRDQNLEDSILDDIETVLSKSDYGYITIDIADIDASWFYLFRVHPRAWKKDRFTSALPFTQRGPEVYIPLSGTAPVASDRVIFENGTTRGQNINIHGFLDEQTTGYNSALMGDDAKSAIITGSVDFDDAELKTTINNFRQAERLQAWYERDARGGARLPENNLAHWGVATLDATLDRAEFLGGEHFPVVISEVAQTSSTDSTSPQGTLAGKASAYNNGRMFKRFTREHGYIIVLSSIMSEAIYSQGLDRIYTRRDRIDYAWPEFAHLGEEPILDREVNMFATDPTHVFGYTPRYSDYKSALSEVHGDFKGTLHFWLQQRKFDSSVALNKQFIFSEPSKEIFALQPQEGVSEIPADYFLVVNNFGLRASRLLPFYGVPSL